MKKLITAAILTAFMSGAAFANACPSHVKKIDDFLAAAPADISAEVQAQAKALRDEGLALHEAGSHAESMAKLAEAEALLGIAQ
jgi:hypothetical protein